MELFTLGAGRGYSERDVREQARALTGFDNDWKRGAGNVNFRFDRERHDAGTKRIFGKRGTFDWQDAVRLCLTHPKHASFFVDKLWRYFIPTAPDAGTRRSLEAMYRKDYEIRPVVEAILRHPALHTGPRMVKPPAVYTAGLLRAIGRGIDTTSWAWLASGSGQRLHAPERRRLGRRALARHRHLPRPLVGRELRHPALLADRQAVRLLPAEPQAPRRGRDRVLGLPTPRPATGRRSSPSRAGRWATRTRSGRRRATAS